MNADDRRHGTLAGHHAGCRQRCCVDARNHYERNQRKRRELGRPGLIPSTGSARRLQALMAIGWNSQHISEHTGITASQLNRISRLQDVVRVDTAAKIAAAYDALSMTLGPSVVTRSRARASGWAVPLAWDDHEIDDPSAQPRGDWKPRGFHSRVDSVTVQRFLDGENLRTTRAERQEITTRWVKSGRSLHELEARTGWKAQRYYEVAS